MDAVLSGLGTGFAVALDHELTKRGTPDITPPLGAAGGSGAFPFQLAVNTPDTSTPVFKKWVQMHQYCTCQH